MISGVLIFNTSAELIISRFYKSDYNRVAAEAFRVKVVQAKKFTSPCVLLDRSSFMYIRNRDLVLVAMTQANANANLVFQFLYQLSDVFQSYFDNEFSEEKIRSNFVLIYELFDEVMDHGYPQIVNANVLQKFIQHGSAKNIGISALEEAKRSTQILANVTGATPWRPPNITYTYEKNEVYLDVIEKVNVIVNKQNKVLSTACTGKICMKSSLSGMPICRFGLNDVLSMQKRRTKRGSKKKVSSRDGINLKDVTFHQCVRLNQYEEDKTIMFIPPDGDYDLMTYRIDKTNLPFDVQALVEERGRNRVEYHIKVKARYEHYNVANGIVINVPVPDHTASVNIKTQGGKATYSPTKKVLEWKLARMSGGQIIILKGEVQLIHLIQDKAWARPPITLQFSIPMWPASGIKVRFLNVQEPKMNYKSVKWVRYLTHAGDYQVRI
jgi:AP-2 complex subunit mu-1